MPQNPKYTDTTFMQKVWLYRTIGMIAFSTPLLIFFCIRGVLNAKEIDVLTFFINPIISFALVFITYIFIRKNKKFPPFNIPYKNCFDIDRQTLINGSSHEKTSFTFTLSEEEKEFLRHHQNKNLYLWSTKQALLLTTGEGNLVKMRWKNPYNPYLNFELGPLK